MTTIAPSILACHLARLETQINEAAAAGATWIHVDVMDGQFVPNISFGLPVLASIRAITSLYLDVHLMIVQPERFIKDFRDAGADGITVHAEATPHAHRAIQAIKQSGAKAGLAINPGTPLEAFAPLLPDLDLALLMSVNPGFGGQSFIPSTLERCRQLRQTLNTHNPNCHIEIDGGVNTSTAKACVDAGATVLVAGSSVYNTKQSVLENMHALQRSLAGQP